VYEIGPFLASTGDLFGFFKKTRIQNEKAEIVVYPRIVPLVPVSLPRRDFFGIPEVRALLMIPYISLVPPITTTEDPQNISIEGKRTPPEAPGKTLRFL
jgi:hypothetical protein